MIIGFTGVKQSGKDTCGAFLVETYEFQRRAFADILKEAVCNLFDIDLIVYDKLKGNDNVAETVGHVILEVSGTTQYDYSWREFIQRFGTEMGRNTFGKNFWVDQWEDGLYRDSIVEDDIVVTDVRFQNEAAKIQDLGGTIVRVTRPGYESDGHVSEEPLPNILIDADINNNGTIEDLQIDVMELYQGLIRGL